jgi:DNA-binding NtrC family response regulator
MRNIRELHNSIERAMILVNDEVLPNMLSASRLTTVRTPTVVSHTLRDSEPAVSRTLRDVERDLILPTLDATGWVIGGFQRRSRTELASVVVYEGRTRELRISNSLNPVKLQSEARLSLCSI